MTGLRRSDGSDFASRAPAVHRRAPLRHLCVVLLIQQPARALAVQRRAPFRRPDAHPGTRPAGQVLPPSSGGLHCGGSCMIGTTGRRPVLLPFNGGLHCGWKVPGGNPPALYMLPPDLRRAPLRLAQRPAGLHRQVPAPAVYRRAPLRQPRRALHDGARLEMLPPSDGGLHCGRHASLRFSGNSRACSRLSAAGSIAARRRSRQS
jgi:hypothetical protein